MNAEAATGPTRPRWTRLAIPGLAAVALLLVLGLPVGMAVTHRIDDDLGFQAAAARSA